MRPTLIEEVELTIKEMAIGKVAGMDGFTTDFFKLVGKS
jgi:hypothetical protein